MIGYVIFGINDFVQGVVFYDVIGKEMGVGWMMEEEIFIVWGEMGGVLGVVIIKLFDGNVFSVGNGIMVVL